MPENQVSSRRSAMEGMTDLYTETRRSRKK
jgi:hypothetical protein